MKRVTALLFIMALTIVSGTSGTSGARAQQERPKPVLQTRSSEVVVDVVVTDKRNRPVTNLEAEDFTVYEDGNRQEIASFHGAGRDANAKVGERPLLSVVLLDYSSTEFQNEKLVRDAAVKYVQERMRPGDRMSVLALTTGLRTLTPFTSDKQALAAAFSWREQVDAAKVGTRPDRALNSNVSVSTPAVSGSTSAGGDLGSADRMAGLFATMMSGVEQRTSRGMLAAIGAISQGVGSLEGRKALILFSQGFIVDPVIQDEMVSVVAAAQRANLSIYCVDPSGLGNSATASGESDRPGLNSAIKMGADQSVRMETIGGRGIFDEAAVSGRDMGESALRFMSAETGGFLIRNANDFTPGLARVDQDMRAYYVLTYRPKNVVMDGKYHAIRVDVRPSGLAVRSRNGYFAAPAGLETLPTAELQFLMAGRNAAGSTAGSLFLRTAGFRESDGRYRLPVILETSAKNVQFTRNASNYSARLTVLGLIRNLSNPEEPPIRFFRPMQVQLTEAEYQALQPGTLSLLENCHLKPGTYGLEVILKDLSSERFYRGEQAIYLREPEQKLALSTIILSNQFGKAGKEDEANPDLLVVGGVKISPSARCEFRNGENVIFFLEVYNPALDPQSKHADLNVKLDLRKGGRRLDVRLPSYHVNEAVPQGHVGLPLARYLQLSGLEPGEYSLVLEVTDALARQTQSTLAAFRVTG